jgi:hypothetical protein
VLCTNEVMLRINEIALRANIALRAMEVTHCVNEVVRTAHKC